MADLGFERLQWAHVTLAESIVQRAAI
jgi:hypothetical protein